MKDRTRKIAIGTMAGLTLLLGISAIAIGLRLRDQISPTDTGAIGDTCPNVETDFMFRLPENAIGTTGGYSLPTVFQTQINTYFDSLSKYPKTIDMVCGNRSSSDILKVTNPSGTTQTITHNLLIFPNNPETSRGFSVDVTAPGTWSFRCEGTVGEACPATLSLTFPGATQSLTCYRCTSGLADANACESQTVTTAACPSGWTTNSNCASAAGGSCPVEVAQCPASSTPTVQTKLATQTAYQNTGDAVTSINSLIGAGNLSYPFQIDVKCNAAYSRTCVYGTSVNRGVSNPLCNNNVQALRVQVGGAGTMFQNCYIGSSEPYTSCESNSSSFAAVATTTTCYRCTTGLSDSNRCESQTVTGACPSGWTTNSNCAAAIGGSCPVQAACGATCGGSIQCGTGYTCDSGTCKLNECIGSPSGCDSTGCNATGFAACGESCDTNADCSTGHTCSGDVCKLNGCLSNPSSCDAGQCNAVQCGDTCTTNSDCPQDGDHTCSDGVCTLDECLDDENCSDECTLISASCGNDVLESGEECDDGNNTNGDGCSAACDIESSGAVCGDGVREGSEQCDDGDTTSGDGCSSTCRVEEIPATALINDDVDRLLMGVGVLVMGVFLWRSRAKYRLQ